MKADYVILEEPTTLDLERAVREMLHDGYEPIGGPNIFVKDDELNYAQAMYRKAKAKRKQAEPFDPPPPPGVNPEVWERHVRIRREKRNPITPAIYDGLLATFDKWRADGFDLNAIVARSNERGWLGLFPPKDKKPANALDFLPDRDDELDAWAARVGAPRARPGEGYTDYRQTLRNWYAKQ